MMLLDEIETEKNQINQECFLLTKSLTGDWMRNSSGAAEVLTKQRQKVPYPRHVPLSDSHLFE
jgi:hypothetical protein